MGGKHGRARRAARLRPHEVLGDKQGRWRAGPQAAGPAKPLLAFQKVDAILEPGFASIRDRKLARPQLAALHRSIPKRCTSVLAVLPDGVKIQVELLEP